MNEFVLGQKVVVNHPRSQYHKDFFGVCTISFLYPNSGCEIEKDGKTVYAEFKDLKPFFDAYLDEIDEFS